MDAYGGDLSKANGLMRGLKGEINELFGLQGEATAIGTNYKAAMANRKALRERREANEITEGQYRE